MVDGGSIPTEIQPHHVLDELFPLLLMILVEIHCSIKCTYHILQERKTQFTYIQFDLQLDALCNQKWIQKGSKTIPTPSLSAN
jgi:hypothetical protein